MNPSTFEKLHREGLISDLSLQKVKAVSENKLFSVHWELRTLLYLGILLLSGGLGILVYKNIDTIGHQFILLFIALVCAGCFYYCVRRKPAFSWQQMVSPNSYYDYILLLGCLTFVTFITYLQVQYNVFGTRYGSATFIPLLVLFFCAYYFDHIGVLSMAIVNLAAWMGIVTTPLQILSANDFSDPKLIYTGLVLGVLLTILAYISKLRNIKAHFTFTYSNFGTHVLLISCLAGMFTFEHIYFLFFLLLAGISAFLFMQAYRNRSFYFLVVITLYDYIGISYVVIRLLWMNGEMGAVYLGLFYFIVSAFMLVLFLIRLNKRIKQA